MIVSSSKKFIFVHIPKTGGTSLRHVLNRYRLWREKYMLGRAWRRLNGGYSFSGHTHAPLLATQHYLNGDVFCTMHKFTIVRHPVDWHFSIYRWILKWRGIRLIAEVYQDAGKIKTFSDYISWRLDHGPIFQITQLVDLNGRLLVDDILRQESLAEDAQRLFRKIGIDETLSRNNMNPIRQSPPTAKEISLIEQNFSEDYRALGYHEAGFDPAHVLNKAEKYIRAGALLKAHGKERFDPWTV